MSGSSPANALLSTVRRLTAGEAPDPQELTAAFDVVFNGDATSAQIAALLIGLRVRGETPAELAAVVRSFRRAMVHLPADRPDELVDTCGTGGGCDQHVQHLDRRGIRRGRQLGCASRNTATGRSRLNAAAPTSSKRSACRSKRR